MNYSSYPPNYSQAAPQYQGFAQPAQPNQFPQSYPPQQQPPQVVSSFPQQNPQHSYPPSDSYPNSNPNYGTAPVPAANHAAMPAPQAPIDPLPEVKTPPKFSVACICQSNVNRSMEAHAILQGHSELSVQSFGVGSKIKIPGETAYSPNVYDFGSTTYDYMVKDLRRKNEAKYIKNGMLRMLERDAQVKTRPQRWQDQKSHFDLIITYEKRVFDIVVSDIESRVNVDVRPCHVINIDTTDNHAEAANGARLTDELVSRLISNPDWEDQLTKHLDEYETKHNKIVLHTVLFY